MVCTLQHIQGLTQVLAHVGNIFWLGREEHKTWMLYSPAAPPGESVRFSSTALTVEASSGCSCHSPLISVKCRFSARFCLSLGRGRLSVLPWRCLRFLSGSTASEPEFITILESPLLMASHLDSLTFGAIPRSHVSIYKPQTLLLTLFTQN